LLILFRSLVSIDLLTSTTRTPSIREDVMNESSACTLKEFGSENR
jgi:hypothetical protein